NRRRFMWRGICSSLPLLAHAKLPRLVAALQGSKPSKADPATFARGLTGTTFKIGDPNYERLRKMDAAKYDAHPALIVRPANLQDLQATLSFVRSNTLPLAVRCGGHSYAGYSTCEGGIVLDMSGFRSITVGADKRSASVGGGVLCGAVEIETAKEGVATALGQCPSVGVGGFLLGGGVSP